MYLYFDFVVRDCFPWILSALGILMTYLAGNLHRNSWGIGIISQVFWLIYVIYTKQYGFLPMSVTLFAIYTKNHIKWLRMKPQAGNIL